MQDSKCPLGDGALFQAAASGTPLLQHVLSMMLSGRVSMARSWTSYIGK